MIISALLAAQAISGLSTVAPRDERLTFVFARGARANPKVLGLSTEQTEWSRQGFYDVVEQCGGQKLTVVRRNTYRVVVTGDSNADDLKVARCVQQSTSAGFSVGVRGKGMVPTGLDQTPFHELWDAGA
ncbi:hypothetical protein [Sphingomonas sp. AX6]|uniref:hypothetical protein n=1 Tax=Sphingomonas sp. AX6 TaxID=2653171 RepID=UPI0012F15383|nr:hypothetical protein [Sphingomonas sp. AX6]VXC62113.1 conserved hypothetical protein [Sphingomonas sp. AX6]